MTVSNEAGQVIFVRIQGGQSNMNHWGHVTGWIDEAGNTQKRILPWDPGFNSYLITNGETRRIAGKPLIHNGRKPSTRTTVPRKQE